jgi:hypothetical protein
VIGDAKCDAAMADCDEHTDHDHRLVERDRFPGRLVLVLALVIGFLVGFAAIA